MNTVINRLFIIIPVLMLSVKANAGNNDLTPRLSAKTIALNGMYIAGSDGLANLFTNPAGLTGVAGSAFELSFLDRTGQQTYHHPEEGLYRTYRDDDISFAGGGYWQINQAITVAAAYSRPVAYNANWPYARFFQEGTSSLVLTFDMFNQLKVGGFSVAGAYRLDRFSFGATINFQQYKSAMAFPVLNDIWYDFVEIEPGYQVSYEQDAWQLGFNLGFSWDVTDYLRCGIVYRSEQNPEFEGLATSALPAAFARLDTNATSIPAGTDDISMQAALPMVFGAGALYRISEAIRINADFAYHMWGSLEKNWQVEFSDAQWREVMSVQDEITGAQPTSIDTPDKNRIEAGIGIEYMTESAPDFRLGYRYSQTPVSAAAISMFFPECDQHWFSFGVNLQNEGYDLDLTIAYVLGMEREISQTQSEYRYGKYDSDLLLAGLTFRYRL